MEGKRARHSNSNGGQRRKESKNADHVDPHMYIYDVWIYDNNENNN